MCNLINCYLQASRVQEKKLDPFLFERGNGGGESFASQGGSFRIVSKEKQVALGMLRFRNRRPVSLHDSLAIVVLQEFEDEGPRLVGRIISVPVDTVGSLDFNDSPISQREIGS